MMKRLLIASCVALLPVTAPAHDGRYSVTVRSVYDGDTLRADIHLGLGLVLEDQPFRLAGLDTPEIRGACETERALAREARDRLRELLVGSVMVSISRREKYGRWLARVYANGRDVAEALVIEGLARTYAGGRRAGWC